MHRALAAFANPPAPQTLKYTCGECRNAAAINTISCVLCDTWYGREA